MCRSRFLFLVLGLLFVSVPAWAQSPERAVFQVQGRVADITNAVLPGATVTLRNLATGLERVVLSDSAGKFSLSGVRPGRYLLIVDAKKFAREVSEFDFQADAEFNFLLRPALQIEEVVVYSGSRQEELRESLNTCVEVIDQDRIQASGSDTVGEVLRSIPGMVTRRGSEGTAAAGEQIQGIDSRQVLVLLDGQPIVGARGVKRGGAINLDRQSAMYLDRIEVVKGAASALYGSDAIGGVINLLSREPRSPYELSLNASGGNYGTLDTNADAGFRNGKLSGLFNLGRHKRNGFDLTPTTFDTTGAGLHRYSSMMKLRYQFAPSFFVAGTAHGYWNTQVGRSVGELGPQYDDDREESQGYGTTADWQATPFTSLQARGYFGRYAENLISALTAPSNQTLEPGTLHETLSKLDATISHVLGNRQFVQVGGEWWTNRYRGENRLRDRGGHRADTGVFWIQDKISVANRLTLTVGTRYDRHSVFGSAVSPKAAANFRLHKSLYVRASYGRGFRAPDLGQLFYRFLNPTNFYQVIGNPNLRPEYANSWQVGGEYTARSRRARVGINLFHNGIKDLIEAVNLGFVASPQQLAAILQRENIDQSFQPQLQRLLFLYKNISNVSTRGVELDGDVALPAKLALGAAYTFLDARDSDAGLRLTGRHRHQGNARLAWENQRLGLRWYLTGAFYSSWIVSRQTVAGTVRDTIAPKFALWDTSVSKSIAKAVTLFAAVYNLGNSRDPNSGTLLPGGTAAPIYRPEIGRSFRLGLRFVLTPEK